MSSCAVQAGSMSWMKQSLSDRFQALARSGCVASSPLSITATVTPWPAVAPVSTCRSWFASHTWFACTSSIPQGMNSGVPV